MNVTAPPRSLRRFFDFCREISVSTMRIYTSREDIHAQDLEASAQIHGHWMSVILVSSQLLRATFKIQMMSRDGKIFASSNFGQSPENLSSAQILDFFKEYCNLVAGKIKCLMEANSVSSGISLPLSFRGFDEVFFHPPDNRFSHLDQWRLSCGPASVTCSLFIESHDEDIWSRIQLNYEIGSEEGDVTFL